MQATDEQDNSSAKDRNMQAFKQEVQNAKQRGLEILPSVDGPDVFNPSTGLVVGRRGARNMQMQSLNLMDSTSKRSQSARDSSEKSGKRLIGRSKMQSKEAWKYPSY